MPTILEAWAQQIGWQIRQHNVIVEGTIDVELLETARELYRKKTNIDIFAGGLAVVAAGRGDDGGVDGVNRRLSAARQLAEVSGDIDAGKVRFIGLFDNDEAGRRALRRACSFDRRVIPYQDVFLLHPVMPPANGVFGRSVEERATLLNKSQAAIDWEIEDLLSPTFVRKFKAIYPSFIVGEKNLNGFIHREFTRSGKSEFRRYVKQYAAIEDVSGIVRLICALRDYFNLEYKHILI